MSRLISGCSGHSYAASKTTAVFLHGTSLSRHTSSFKARSPGQPSTAQSRKVSRSLTALNCPGSAQESWPKQTCRGWSRCEPSPWHFPKMPSAKQAYDTVQQWKYSCSNLLHLPSVAIRQSMLLASQLSRELQILDNTCKRHDNFSAGNFKECCCSTLRYKRQELEGNTVGIQECLRHFQLTCALRYPYKKNTNLAVDTC